jgi:chromosomal replication initiation ATPase DnaA
MIKIRTPSKSEFEGVDGIHKCLQPHFITLLVGKPGSGKSHIISEFLVNKDLYNRKFDEVYFVAASKIGDLEMDEENWCPHLDIEWMFKQVRRARGSGESRNILFVLDDVIGEIKEKQNDKRLMALIFNRRHLVDKCVISYLITSQKYMVCPPRLRSCITSIITFKVMNNDYRKIVEECVYEELDKHKSFVIRNHLNIPFNFLYIRLDNGDIYLNFEKFKYNKQIK